MSKRYKRDKTTDSVNHQGSSCTTHYRNNHLQPDWSQCCQHCDDNNNNVIRRLHSPHRAPAPPPTPPPTCLHLPASYISSHVNCHPHNNDTTNTTNNNNSSNSSAAKHGSQSIVEKAIFRMIKCFDHKSSDRKLHQSTTIATSEDCLQQSDSSCEERPLISNREYTNNNNNSNNNNVYPKGASVVGDGSTASTSSTCINPTEVEDWMRRRLYYHFMTPIGKFHAKRRIPFKLFIQILKVLLVTIQLIHFGFNRAAHVSFGELSHTAFCHLYLHRWDSQYETLDYPPATGVYAVYTIDAFYEHVGYAITQFNKTKELALGGYLFDSTNPTMKLCMKYVSPPMENKSTLFRVALQEVEKCVSIEPQKIDAKQLQDVDAIKNFLEIHGLNIDFDQ
ncbi:unnamed protein product [Trichobilharzia szidati]|nr:unnamed protein product [Trichobilharzia szidati]